MGHSLYSLCGQAPGRRGNPQLQGGPPRLDRWGAGRTRIAPRMRQVGLVASLGLALLGMGGCVIARGYRDRPIDEKVIAAIQPGVTTKADILRLFGPPQEVSEREILALGGSGEPPAVGVRYFRYRYSRLNGFIVFGLLLNYIDADLKSDNLVVFFDDKGVVEDFAFAKDTEQLPRFGFLSR